METNLTTTEMTTVLTITNAQMTICQPTATDSDIISELKKQIAETGSATALSVKLALRENGFIAFQAVVSQTLKNCYQMLNFNANYNGKFLTYTPTIISID